MNCLAYSFTTSQVRVRRQGVFFGKPTHKSTRQYHTETPLGYSGTPLRVGKALRLRNTTVCGVAVVAEDKGSTKPSNPWWMRDPQPNMIEVNGTQELVDVLACFSSRLVIVDFYATWCNACRALYPKLIKLCKENPDMVIVKVNWEKNRDISKALGIKVLPYFQFYYGPHGKVAQFSASVSKINRLKDAIAEHTTPRCLIAPLVEPILEEFPNVHPMNEVNISGNVVSFDGGISGLNKENQEFAFA
eukprot:TRINITY_DN2554_c0_g1_i1.p1 TRINITY_DN2554_c0_g1~~TRINITY_DN2554_c0_g1_i1.p1  ORF type:complete len:246 (-),score=13.91 TRINITY_DN2554_c0_g1_i1:646-1383(-)